MFIPHSKAYFLKNHQFKLKSQFKTPVTIGGQRGKYS